MRRFSLSNLLNPNMVVFVQSNSDFILSVNGIYIFTFVFVFAIPFSLLQSENFAEENELALDDEMCYGKRCTANEHCCPGSVCVDVDGGKCSLN